MVALPFQAVTPEGHCVVANDNVVFFCERTEMEEEIFDKVVDLTEYAKRQPWWNRLFGKNSGPVAEKYSVATQIAIGGVSGW